MRQIYFSENNSTLISISNLKKFVFLNSKETHVHRIYIWNPLYKHKFGSWAKPHLFGDPKPFNKEQMIKQVCITRWLFNFELIIKTLVSLVSQVLTLYFVVYQFLKLFGRVFS